MRPMELRQTLAEGRFVRLVAADGWEWVERVNASGAVVLVAITEDDELLLVEQFRIPLGRRVIELPAGLVGDGAGRQREEQGEAARRELLEETGYQADAIEFLLDGPSSAGLAAEVYSLFLARNVRRVGPGGGDGSEDIQVHRVPRTEAEAWLDVKRRVGVMVDPKVYAGLYLAERR
ncbi:MAG: NUDIX hydrolase [Planctomycetaceae bacterium]|nr:NUDIX hydrolase [Planctomycetaceae bacterium]